MVPAAGSGSVYPGFKPCGGGGKYDAYWGLLIVLERERKSLFVAVVHEQATLQYVATD